MKRKYFNNIAQGLLGSFISRNNDIDGYWGIGKLLAFLLAEEKSIATIDLLAKSMHPNNDSFEGMIKRYAQLLAIMKMKNGQYNPEHICSCIIRLEIGEKRTYSQRTCLKCLITIIDDLGKHHTNKREIWCWPHDPSKESRSARY